MGRVTVSAAICWFLLAASCGRGDGFYHASARVKVVDRSPALDVGGRFRWTWTTGTANGRMIFNVHFEGERRGVINPTGSDQRAEVVLTVSASGKSAVFPLSGGAAGPGQRGSVLKFDGRAGDRLKPLWPEALDSCRLELR